MIAKLPFAFTTAKPVARLESHFYKPGRPRLPGPRRHPDQKLLMKKTLKTSGKPGPGLARLPQQVGLPRGQNNPCIRKEVKAYSAFSLDRSVKIT
jgi:hypothetical protein